MDLFFRTSAVDISRKDPPFFLAFTWTAGIIAGVFASSRAGHYLSSLMHQTIYSPVSIIGLLLAMLLPLMCSAFAVYISCPWLLIPIVFGKGFLYSYFSFGILTAYGSAGWLIRLLLIFSDTWMLPVLWYFWLGGVKKGRAEFIYRLLPAVALVFLIGCVDYSVITPFLAAITSN